MARSQPGIAVSDGERTTAMRDMGLVSQVFDGASLAALEAGHMALGHVRYSTTGSASWENAQPEFGGRGDVNVAVAHNGNLVNAVSLREGLAEDGFRVLLHLGHDLYSRRGREGAGAGPFGRARLCRAAMRHFEGAYSVAMIFRDKLVAFRDPHGFRPLCIGEVDGGYAVSSETCGLDIIGARFLRDVEPGEVVVIDDEGLTSYTGREPAPRALRLRVRVLRPSRLALRRARGRRLPPQDGRAARRGSSGRG